MTRAGLPGRRRRRVAAAAVAVALVGERRPLLGWQREPRVEGLGVGAEGG